MPTPPNLQEATGDKNNMGANLEIDDRNFFAEGIPSEGKAAIAPTRRDCLALSPRLDDLRERLPGWRRGNPPSFLMLPFAKDVETVVQLGHELGRRFRQTIVLGIGGSSLGGEMLTRVLGHGIHPIAFYDNLDPGTLFDP